MVEQGPITLSTIERESTPEALATKLANAFLKNSYPLSADGVQLKNEIEQIKKRGGNFLPIAEALPTVERPREELYRDTIESEGDDLTLWSELADVQVSKGCRHKCSFCAAGAAPKVEMMPFPAIGKIASRLRTFENSILEKRAEWIRYVQAEKGLTLKPGLILQAEEWDSLGSFYKAHYNKFDISKYYPLHGYANSNRGFDMISQRTLGYINWMQQLPPRSITNYYDSDPFDYRDSNFLHDDGSPSDYGDVVTLLASPLHPVHITTAGWRKSDKTSLRAAKKIIALGRDLLFDPRISINPYELQLLQGDMEGYRESMVSVIETLKPLKPRVLLFSNQAQGYEAEVIQPIMAYAQSAELEFVRGALSFFSGPMSDTSVEEDHHDVMACMPGYHIWPDGSVQIQARDSKAMFRVPKGSRPQSVGKKLW